MRTSLEDMIIRHEGEVLYAYADSLGYQTIGVGRLIDKRRGGGISHDEAMILLRNDIDKCRSQLDASIPWWRDQTDARRDVLVDMCFNLGIQGLLKFKNMLAFIQAGDYTAAADAMLKSKWARQVGYRATELWNSMIDG